MRPVIGISTYREQARWGVWHAQADLLNAEYARAVTLAGGVPVLLPPTDDPEAAAEVVSRLDALVIAGGADFDPGRYGQRPQQRTGAPRADRDGWEIALLDAAEDQTLPVLGVCRGMQVMAVHAGGSLEQHLPDVVSHEGHSPGGDVYGTIAVDTVAGSRIAALIGPQVQVACHHHQAVITHPGYTPTAHAADGTLEAMEREDRDFWLGVQWHPEARTDQGLFKGLVERCRGIDSILSTEGRGAVQPEDRSMRTSTP
jgi:putative glutamine amidotransferase